MYYQFRATLYSPEEVQSNYFHTILAAETWLDANNNNFELTSKIEELDTSGKVVDWFYYTEGV